MCLVQVSAPTLPMSELQSTQKNNPSMSAEKLNELHERISVARQDDKKKRSDEKKEQKTASQKLKKGHDEPK